MSIEVTILCDGCGEIMAASRTAKAARVDAKRSAYHAVQRGRLDYCDECAALPPPPATEEDSQ